MRDSFDLYGAPAHGEPPAGPVVVSVPHAGRDYPLALRAALRVPFAALTGLEDRRVDAVALAARVAEVVIVQRTARAFVDLNRGEDERDPRVDEGAPAGTGSAKVRSGLGLIPRRTGRAGELWTRRFAAEDVAARIAAHHRPYHARIAALLAAARAHWGAAVLLDLHSMPPLPAGGARVVIGDRFGKSAGARLVARVEAEARAARLATALNSPYAGGHILDRHGAPARGIHAVQMEIDRSLYLDTRLDWPGARLASTAALVRRIVAALAEEVAATTFAEAAE